jgi:hypothetical protein
MQLLGVSTDNGVTWQGYAMQTEPDTENDPAWFDAYALNVGAYSPVASDSVHILTIGDSPRHSVVAYGSTFTDGIPAEDWNFAYDNIGQTRLLTKAGGGQYIGVTGYINDGVHNTAVVVTIYPAGSRGVCDMIYDGTQFIAIATEWQAGYTVGWLAATADGESWTNYFTAEGEAPGGFNDLARIRKIGTRYFIAGRTDSGSANIPIAYSDAPLSSWTLATASEGIFQGARDIAGEE